MSRDDSRNPPDLSVGRFNIDSLNVSMNFLHIRETRTRWASSPFVRSRSGLMC